MKNLNWIFATLVALLSAVAGITMYQNRNLPVIADAPPESQLPPNHPPLDAANRLTAMEQLSASQPQNAELKRQFGNACYDTGQYQRAIGAYEDYLRLQPNIASVETDLATCYHMLGQSAKALDIIERVLQYQPGFPQALFNKGVVLQAMNNKKGAIAVWEQLLEKNPDFAQKSELQQRIQQMKASTP